MSQGSFHHEIYVLLVCANIPLVCANGEKQPTSDRSQECAPTLTAHQIMHVYRLHISCMSRPSTLLASTRGAATFCCCSRRFCGVLPAARGAGAFVRRSHRPDSHIAAARVAATSLCCLRRCRLLLAAVRGGTASEPPQTSALQPARLNRGADGAASLIASPLRPPRPCSSCRNPLELVPSPSPPQSLGRRSHHPCSLILEPQGAPGP